MKNLSDELKNTLKKPKYNKTYKEIVDSVLNDATVKQFIKDHSDDLDESAVNHAMSKLFEFVKENNKLKNNEVTTIPGFEPILVVNNGMIDISYVPTNEQKEKIKLKKIKKRITTVSIPKSIRDAGINDFDYKENNSRILAMRRISLFIRDYDESPKKWHQGTFLTGRFGVGKTFLMGAMANELAKKGHLVSFIHFPTFVEEMKKMISNDGFFKSVDSIKRSPILIIDDIGSESMSSWVRDNILGIIMDFRMQNTLPTFFTSNLTMDEFEEFLSENNKGDEEPLQAKRIMQRVRFLSKEVEIGGRNRRPQ